MPQGLSFAAQQDSYQLCCLVLCSLFLLSVVGEISLFYIFNKLPYVSICSSTAEWELTFQSAGS